MNVTFRQLKLFLAFADSTSVSQAARAMHVTQPTASMQLKEMTDAIGLPLYEVIGRKCYLTDAGRELASTARSMLDQWERFEQTTDAAKGLARGKLKIAVVSTAKYFMPHLIGQFCNKYPKVDIALEILNRDGVVDRLRNNRDDLYIMSMPPKDIDLLDEVFLDNPIVLVAKASTPLLKRRRLQLTDLLSERFILRERGSGTRMVADQHFKVERFKPDIRLELGSNEAIKEAVAGGLGIGVISKHALHGQQMENGVSVIKVEGFPLQSSWRIVHPRPKKLSPLAEAFKSHIRESLSARSNKTP